LAKDIAKDKTLCVQQTSDGKTYIVVERKHMNNSPSVETSSPSKKNLEFSRYKQDCRKRAMDVAQVRLSELIKDGFLKEDLKDNEGKVIAKEIAQENMLLALCDKYYTWLINIPQ